MSERSARRTRIAWLATHPIQYQVPLLRAIANSAQFELRALFFSDFSARQYHDKEFGQAIAWDAPLLEGFDHVVLHEAKDPQEAFSFTRPRVPQLAQWLTRAHFDVVVIQGWNHHGYLYAAWLARRAGLKVILRCEATDHVTGSQGLKRGVREAMLRWLFKRVDGFGAIGEHNRRFYLARGVAPSRIVDMPYCVDNDHFREKAAQADLAALRRELAIDTDDPVILYASKLTSRKYADLLLDAYCELPSPRPWLVVVGDGELRPTLESRIRERHLDRVRMAGFRNQGELPAFYALADVFVLPSVNETWGLVVNEAMNAGCAIVVTTQVGSGLDLVVDGVNGAVVPPGDLQALQQALVNVLTDRRFTSMGDASLEKISKWGIQENLAGLAEVIERFNRAAR